ncbi:MAG: hypothetical protein ACOCUT_04490, partial [bacterium]
EFYWSGSRLVEKEHIPNISKLLPPDNIMNPEKVSSLFNSISKKKGWKYYSQGQFYQVSHSLAQTALATSKSKRKNIRKEEPGEKCIQCGEFEILHDKSHISGESASIYKQNIEEFWEKIRIDSNRKENEKLCSLCYSKRVAYRLFEKNSEHVLSNEFMDLEAFPSTTEISMHNYFEKKGILDKHNRENIAQKAFENSNAPGSDLVDRYYSILIMDGDKMGDLVNGNNIEATWDSIIHADLVKKLDDDNYYRAFPLVDRGGNKYEN